MVSSRVMELSRTVLRWPEAWHGGGIAAIEYLLGVSILACLAWASVAAFGANAGNFIAAHWEARLVQAAGSSSGDPVSHALAASAANKRAALTVAIQMKSR